jgi:hypothetical protein
MKLSYLPLKGWELQAFIARRHNTIPDLVKVKCVHHWVNMIDIISSYYYYHCNIIHIYTIYKFVLLHGWQIGLSLWGMLDNNVSWTEHLEIQTDRLNKLHDEQLHNLYSSPFMNWMHHLQHKWCKCICSLNNAFNGNLRVNAVGFQQYSNTQFSIFLCSVRCMAQTALKWSMPSWSYSTQIVTITLTVTHLAHLYSTCLSH